MNESRRLLLRRLTAAVAVWSLCYAIYRGYYAAGGTFGVPGVPDPHGPFRLINAVAAVILGVTAILPVMMLPLWSRRRARPVLLAVSWAFAVGCIMHALIDSAQRVLSVAGVLSIDYPSEVWVSVDHRAADLQDLLLNEPWFLVEGLTFGAWDGRCWTPVVVGVGGSALSSPLPPCSPLLDCSQLLALSVKRSSSDDPQLI